MKDIKTEQKFVIDNTREFYQEYAHIPSQRALLNYIKANHKNNPNYNHIDSIWLLKLFYDPNNTDVGTMQQIIKLADLPEPSNSCI